MPLFRPPQGWQYQNALSRYEAKFRRQTPQWVLTLGLEETRQLIGVALRLDWKLAPKILVGGEDQSGPESLWSPYQTRLDVETAWRLEGKFRPRDLQRLPMDPAAAALKKIQNRPAQ